MQSRRLHRLSRFRRNKRRLRDRLRQRIFFGEDKETPETMEKPRVVVLTGATAAASCKALTSRPMRRIRRWRGWKRRWATISCW